MLVKIYLHGHLRDKINKDFVETEALTVMDALQSLANTYKKELKAPLDIGRWRVKIKGYETKESWYVPLIDNELHVYPVFRTAKNAWATVAIGALMVAAVVFSGPLGLSGIMAAGIGTSGVTVGSVVFSAGVGIMLSGVMNILFPTPKLDTSAESGNNSKYLGAQGNTVAAGTRIPFGYGLFKISGHFISYNVSSTVIRETD